MASAASAAACAEGQQISSSSSSWVVPVVVVVVVVEEEEEEEEGEARSSIAGSRLEGVASSLCCGVKGAGVVGVAAEEGVKGEVGVTAATLGVAGAALGVENPCEEASSFGDLTGEEELERGARGEDVVVVVVVVVMCSCCASSGV